MAQPVSPTIEKQELTPDQTKYIKREELEEVLKKTFGDGLDFNVSTKSSRWIYYAKRKLSDKEVRNWISELEKRKKKKAQMASAAADGKTTTGHAGEGGGSSGGA